MADLFVIGPADAGVADEGQHPPDWRERERALDTTRSWIVEAPAGSGKTGLLIQRYLKLLSDESVTAPEQVLAITFTVKATAEIRERVMEQLEAAFSDKPLKRGDAFEQETRTLAERVVERDRLGRWGLLESSQRLNVRTIDSVCAQIASSLPVLSGGGGQQTPVPDAGRLHHAAARRTLMLLGGEDAALNEALRRVLLHRDGNLADCEELLAEMLELRDQWGELVPLQRRELDDAYLNETVLPRLERALELAICAGIARLAEALPDSCSKRMASLAAEFAELPAYKPDVHPFSVCRGMQQTPAETLEDLERWRTMISLVVKKDGGWRARFHKNDLGVELNKHHGAAVKALVDELRDNSDLPAVIGAMQKLPPAKYPAEQWAVAKSLFRMLSRALVELQLVFAERSECDFAELGLRAIDALRADDGVADLETALGMRVQHLLVDEMQDTSTRQYELIERLTQSWDGHSQTVFLVGDPKQSIYIFRQARVERFIRTMREERLGDLEIGCIRLTANFRSQGGLVEKFNQDFSLLFPDEADPANPEAVDYFAADAVRPVSKMAKHAVWHFNTLANGVPREKTAEAKRQQKLDEAEAVRAVVQEWRACPLPPGRTEPWRIAVLVRGRNYLIDIVAALKRDDGDGAIPFRAVNIEALKERQEVLDLTALTRALLHPADRVAWLAALRAPWCGLGLADLHMLVGEDNSDFKEQCIQDLMAERGHLLSDEGCARLTRFWPVMRDAATRRGQLTTAQWVERTWRSLGGDASLSASEMANARRYFQLLDEIEAEGEVVDMAVLAQRLEKLFAESAVVPGAIDVMTIHGAKGLEWDVVLVPGLERKSPPNRNRLLTWNEFDQRDAEAARVVLAPIAGKGQDSHALNKWLTEIQNAREAAERKRLFYVVCTRAREELHLFASPALKVNGEVNLAPGSLLGAAWPAASVRFYEDARRPQAPANLVTMAPWEATVVADLAAGAEERVQPAGLRRLPLSFDARARFDVRLGLKYRQAEDAPEMTHFERPEGSFAARSFGNAVHGFLDVLSTRLAAGASVETLLREVKGWLPRIETILRGDGLSPAVVKRRALEVRSALENVLQDRDGLWVLGTQAGAASEYAFTSWADQRRSYRLDRIFRAGAEPHAAGNDCLWIIDYKTSTHGREGSEDFLGREREKYGPQMEAYARAVRLDAEATEIRVGLYYPMLPRLIWWRPEPI